MGSRVARMYHFCSSNQCHPFNCSQKDSWHAHLQTPSSSHHPQALPSRPFKMFMPRNRRPLYTAMDQMLTNHSGASLERGSRAGRSASDYASTDLQRCLSSIVVQYVKVVILSAESELTPYSQVRTWSTGRTSCSKTTPEGLFMGDMHAAGSQS